MNHRPWYQFPFGGMMQVIKVVYDFKLLTCHQEYFSILLKEAQVVFKKQGLVKAGLSKAFLTDLIPGLVMALLFGQMILLALPLRMALGDSYSPSMVATQVERLIVVGKEVKWGQVHPEIRATNLVKGLHVLDVPSLGCFTDAIKALAKCDLRILDISGHSEVQVKVAVPKEKAQKMEQILALEAGTRVMFQFQLPTEGGPEGETPECLLSLEVQAVHLLNLVRNVEEMGDMRIVQVYDFWA